MEVEIDGKAEGESENENGNHGEGWKDEVEKLKLIQKRKKAVVYPH